MKIKKISGIAAIEEIYLFFLGFIGFSRMSQYVIFSILHLPFYLIEIFFMPFLIYTWPEYINYLQKIIKKKKFVFWTMLIAYDIAMGIVYTFDPINTITMSRSLVYIILIALIFEEKKSFSVEKMFIVSLASMLGELFYGIKYSGSDIASINTTCLAIMVLIPMIKKNYVMFVICSILGLIISINSGYRIGIIVLILIVLESIIWMVMSNEKKNRITIIGKMIIPIVAIMAVGFIVINYDALIEFSANVLGTSQYAVYRVTKRLEGLFKMDFDMSREAERFEMFSVALTSFLPRVIPRGLVGKSIGTLGAYFDVPITYLYDAFGSFASIGIVLVCCKKGLNCFLGAFKRDNEDYFVLAGLMFPVLLLCLVVNGSFLYITFQCITTGIIVGEWFAYKSYKFRKST